MNNSFLNVLKYLVYRKAANAILKKTSVGVNSINQISLENYDIPKLNAIPKTLFFHGLVFTLGYLSVMLIPIIFEWKIISYILTIIVFIVALSEFLPPYIAFQYKDEPQYTSDQRYKSGKRLIGTKKVIDKNNVIPLPAKAKLIKFICGGITLTYLLTIGIPGAVKINEIITNMKNEVIADKVFINSIAVGDSVLLDLSDQYSQKHLEIILGEKLNTSNTKYLYLEIDHLFSKTKGNIYFLGLVDSIDTWSKSKYVRVKSKKKIEDNFMKSSRFIWIEASSMVKKP